MLPERDSLPSVCLPCLPVLALPDSAGAYGTRRGTTSKGSTCSGRKGRMRRCKSPSRSWPTGGEPPIWPMSDQGGRAAGVKRWLLLVPQSRQIERRPFCGLMVDGSYSLPAFSHALLSHLPSHHHYPRILLVICWLMHVIPARRYGPITDGFENRCYPKSVPSAQAGYCGSQKQRTLLGPGLASFLRG